MRAFICICMCLLGIGAFGQRQLSNFEPTQEISSYPSYFVEFAGYVIYLATDKAHGRNVWISDGTTAGTRFFFESESDFPSENVLNTIEYKGNLYLTSLHNIYLIERNLNIKKLNNFEFGFIKNPTIVDSVLLLNPGNYIDLRDNSFKTYTVTTSLKDIYNSQYNILLNSAHYAINFNFSNSSFVLFDAVKQVSYTFSSDEIGKYVSPQRIFEFKERIYLFMSDGQFFEFQNGKLLAIESQLLKDKNEFYSYQTKDKISFAQREKGGSEIMLVDYDGKSFVSKKANSSPSNLYMSIILSENDSLITAYGRQIGYGANKVFLYNKFDGNLEVILDSAVYIEPIKIIKIKDKTYLYGTKAIDYLEGNVYSTWLFDSKNRRLVEQQFTEPVALDNKILANKPTSKNGKIDYELYEVSGNVPILIKDELGKTYSDFSLGGNQYSGSVYAIKNENGQVIYDMNLKSNFFNKIYESPSESFYQNFRHNPRQGTYGHQDLGIFGYGIDKKTTQIFNFDSSNGNNYFSINEDSKKVSKLETLPYYGNYVSDTLFKLYNSKNPLEPFTVKLPVYSTIVYTGFPFNNYIFQADSSKYFKSQLFRFSNKNKLERIFNEEVKTFSWNNYLIVLKKSGDLYLVDNNESLKTYYIMHLKDTWNKELRYQFFDDGFVIYTDNQLWYSDGNCKNSKLIFSNKYQQFFSNFNKLSNSEFIFSTGSGFYIYNGKKTFQIKGPFNSYLGKNNRKLFFSNFLEPNINNIPLFEQYSAYTYDLDTKKYEEIFTAAPTSGYFFQQFRNIPNSAKKNIYFGDTSYLINQNNIIEKLPGSYANSIYDNAKGILILGENMVYIWNNGVSTELIKSNNYITYNRELESDSYFYLHEYERDGIRTMHRISKLDYSVRKIQNPFPISKFKTNADIADIYPIRLLGNKLFAKIISPSTGPQVWELDDSPQKNLIIDQNFTPVFNFNPNCEANNYSQVIPETVPEQSQVFPNPTSSDLSVVLPSDFVISNSTLSLISIDGKLINQNLKLSPYGHLKNLYNISLPYLTAGQYQLIIIDGQGKKSSYKFVRH